MKYLKGGDGVISAVNIRDREAINIRDGRRLGVISDIEIDLEEGKIVSVIIPGGGKFFGFFGRESEIVIPWESITKIGVDVVLVDIEERDETVEHK